MGVEPKIGVVNPPKWMVDFMENRGTPKWMVDFMENRGTPKWMVDFMENPMNKWDDLGGFSPHIFGGNAHILG